MAMEKYKPEQIVMVLRQCAVQDRSRGNHSRVTALCLPIRRRKLDACRLLWVKVDIRNILYSPYRFAYRCATNSP